MPDQHSSRRRALTVMAAASVGGAGFALANNETAHAPGTHPESVHYYGAIGDGTSDDTAAFASALRHRAGAQLFVPAGSYVIRKQLKLTNKSSSLLLERGATIKWEGGRESCLLITGEEVLVTGGTFLTDLSADPTNTPWENAVIEATETARGVSLQEITIHGVPKVGIGIRCADARVLFCSVYGGTDEGIFTGVETTHFGIAYDPPQAENGGAFLAEGNHVESCVQGIALGNIGAGNGRSQIISNNIFRRCWNHGIYQSSGLENTTISGNSFFECQSPVTITGSNNVVTGNTCSTASTGRPIDWAGISLRNASNCVVSNNAITGDLSPSAVAICLEATAEGEEVRGNVVSGNVIDVRNTKGNSAIRLGGGKTSTLLGNRVIGNTIRGGGSDSVGVIAITSSNAKSSYGNEISWNSVTMVNPHKALTIENATQTRIAGNTFIEDYAGTTPIDRIGIHVKATAEETLIEGTVFRCAPGRGRSVRLTAIKLDGPRSHVAETVLPSGEYVALTAIDDKTRTSSISPTLANFSAGSAGVGELGRMAVFDANGRTLGYVRVYAD